MVRKQRDLFLLEEKRKLVTNDDLFELIIRRLFRIIDGYQVHNIVYRRHREITSCTLTGTLT